MAMRSDKGTSPSSLIHSVQADGRGNEHADLSSIAMAGGTARSASSSEAAHYVADMLESLEKLANRNELNVLGLMLAMAKDQADDDAGKMDAPQVNAAF